MYTVIRISAYLICLTTAIISANTASYKLAGNGFSIKALNIDPFDPNSWEPDFTDPLTGCPQSGKVCFIDVPDSDVYPAAHPTYPNLPKVLQTVNTGELADDIQTALANSTDPTTFGSGASSRIIYEMNYIH